MSDYNTDQQINIEKQNFDTSYQVQVEAKSIYLEEYSKPKDNNFLFCYKITISNNGSRTVKLLNRHWIIIDSNSKRNEVKGPGIVGLQPELAPGESHQYFSFCNLETNFGTMEGSYEFVDEDNEHFLAEIPRFFLADNLNEFDKPQFKRGAIVKHVRDDFKALVTDYDMYFINDEEIYKKHPGSPDKSKPWYYVLVNKSNAISYVAQEDLKNFVPLDEEEQFSFEHPLVNFFFDGYDDQAGSYLRNEKTWEQLKRGGADKDED